MLSKQEGRATYYPCAAVCIPGLNGGRLKSLLENTKSELAMAATEG